MERCHNWVTSIVGGQRELGIGTVLHKPGPSLMFQNGMWPHYPWMINDWDFTLAKWLLLEAFKQPVISVDWGGLWISANYKKRILRHQGWQMSVYTYFKQTYPDINILLFDNAT